jgi:hypothetical protein
MVPLSVELQFSATGAIYRRLTGNRGHGPTFPSGPAEMTGAPVRTRGFDTVTAVRGAA